MVGNQVAVLPSAFWYAPPVIIGIGYPDQLAGGAPTRPPRDLNIVGDNFGTDANLVDEVKVGSLICSNVFMRDPDPVTGGCVGISSSPWTRVFLSDFTFFVKCANRTGGENGRKIDGEI